MILPSQFKQFILQIRDNPLQLQYFPVLCDKLRGGQGLLRQDERIELLLYFLLGGRLAVAWVRLRFG